jgi:hypothetical protein
MVRGAFTRDLVDLLNREKDLTRITYSALIEKLPSSDNQHPQCSGKNRGRALFGILAHRPTLFKLCNHCGTYGTEAGNIHGVAQGTPFAIHTFDDITSVNSEIDILKTDYVFSLWYTLRRRSGEDSEFDIPPGARALMLNWRPDANILKVCISLDDIPPEPNLSEVLKGVSHFNFRLARGNIGQPLKKLIEISEEAIYVPDGDTGMPLAVDCENIVFATSEANGDHDLFYGRHLFPYLVYFDPSDYSIQVRS